MEQLYLTCIYHRQGKNDKGSVKLLPLRAWTKANTKGNGRRGVKIETQKKSIKVTQTIEKKIQLQRLLEG